MSWLTRALRIFRKLRRSPVPATPIAQLVEGQPSRIVGVAEATGPMLTTPVDAQACIGFRLFIERRRSGGDSEWWDPVLGREDCQAFSVRDETGLAIVEKPVALQIDVDIGGWGGVPSEVYALLDEAKVSYGGKLWDYEVRYRMGVLKAGERISVEGQATLQIDPSVKGPNHRSVPEAWHFKDGGAWPVVVRDVDDPEP